MRHSSQLETAPPWEPVAHAPDRQRRRNAGASDRASCWAVASAPVAPQVRPALAQPAPRLLAAPAPQAAPAVPAQAAGQRRPAVGRPAGRLPAERARTRVAVA